MCTNGINASQLKGAIVQVDEAVALSRRWLHRCYHGAEDGLLLITAEKLKDAQFLLDEVRSLLDEAVGIVENETPAESGVTVKLV